MWRPSSLVDDAVVGASVVAGWGSVAVRLPKRLTAAASSEGILAVMGPLDRPAVGSLLLRRRRLHSLSKVNAWPRYLSSLTLTL